MKTVITFAIILGILSGGIYYYVENKGLTSIEAQEIQYPTLTENLDVQHPSWSGTLIPVPNEDGRVQRKDTNDYATVLELTPEMIKISWDNWGIEIFQKDTDGVYKLKKD